MSRFIPVYAYPNKMPVDISFVFEDEKPAGKHGFTQAKGENLYFEDGTLAKFWGVMFNGAACFPPHERAEAVAEILRANGAEVASVVGQGESSEYSTKYLNRRVVIEVIK